MSILDKYENMECVLKRTSTEKDRRLGVFNTEKVETIKCFVYGDLKLLRTEQGEMKLSNQTVLTTTAVKIGDFIDDHEVVAVHPIPNMQGIIEFYEVTL